MARLAAAQLQVMPEIRPPAGADDLLTYLNAIPGLRSEGVYRMNNYSVTLWFDEFVILNGDQPVFYAKTAHEAYCFVAGLAVMSNEFLARAIDPAQLYSPDEQ